MSHKSEQEWHQHVMAGRWLLAYHAFLGRLRAAYGLKGVYEYASHPARKSLLVPALVRHMVVDPETFQEGGDNWTLSQGVAFQVTFEGSDYYKLRTVILKACFRTLWKRRIQVWVGSGDGDLPGFLGFLHRCLNGSDTNFDDSKSFGPADMAGANIGETLWVRADTKGRDFDALLGQPIDLEWASAVKQEILSEYRACADQLVDEYAADGMEIPQENEGLFYPRHERDAVLDELKMSLDLTNPLDIYEGWKRQKLFHAMQRTMLQVAYGYPVQTAVVDLCPHEDGTIDGLSWKVMAAPQREVLAELLWPEQARDGVLERMPKDLSDVSWQPFLYAWQRPAQDLTFHRDSRMTDGLTDALNQEAGNVSVVVVIAVQECLRFSDCWDPKAREWLKPYLDQPLPGVVFRLHEILPSGMVTSLSEPLVRQLMEELAARVVQDATVNSSESSPADGDLDDPARLHLPPLTLVPDWHSDQNITLEQATFGLQGRLIPNSVADWPEGLERSFNPEESLTTENNNAIRGPAHMLRCGLGTWIHQALSDYGQRLVSEVLLRDSPVALEESRYVGPILDTLSVEDSLSLSQVLGSETMRTVWGWEFSWGVAFALGGAKHAAVEVRPSLQERLDHTIVDNDVPAWTLQGPSPLTYVQFGYPLLIGNRRFSDREAKRTIFGAYIWTKEHEDIYARKVEVQETEVTIDLAVAIVGVDEFARIATNVKSSGFSLKYFKSFRWQGLDARTPIIELISQLSQTLEVAMVESANDPLLHKGEDSEQNAIEEKRHDEMTFEMAMQSLAKVLLYMGLREARIEHEDKSYGDNVGRGEHPLLEPRSNKNKARLEKTRTKATLLHKIRIGPVRFDEEDENDDADDTGEGSGKHGGSKRPHYRVGHFRMQACGEGWRDRIRIWLKPQLIGSKKLLGGPPRLYDLG